MNNNENGAEPNENVEPVPEPPMNGEPIDECNSNGIRKMPVLGWLAAKYDKYGISEWITVQPRKTPLHELIAEKVLGRKDTDVDVIIDGETIGCHFKVLLANSEYFKNLRGTRVVELPADQVSPEIFNTFYDWMLGKPVENNICILDLLKAASFLRIKELLDFYRKYLDMDHRIEDEILYLLYFKLLQHRLKEITDISMPFICKNFLTLVATNAFLKLNDKEICKLLDSNIIGVNSEIEVFLSAYRWLNHNWDERQSYMLDVMKCVRFGLMPFNYLTKLYNHTMTNYGFDKIIYVQEVRVMIANGLSYASMPNVNGGNDEHANGVERPQEDVFVQRQWVIDKCCSYHHYYGCPSKQDIAYKTFLDYLQMLNTIGTTSIEITLTRRSWLSLCCLRFTNEEAGVVEDRISSQISYNEATGKASYTYICICTTIILLVFVILMQ